MQFNKNKASSGGGILQIVSNLSGGYIDGTGVISVDDSVPQKNEGDEIYTKEITPKIIGSILQIVVNIHASYATGGSTFTVALFKNDDDNCLICSVNKFASSGAITHSTLKYDYVTVSIEPVTFKVRAGNTTLGTWAINGSSGGRKMGGNLISGITIKELNI